MAELDLTACYPAEAGLKRVVRTLWLSEKNLVVLADRVRGASIETIAYHWHGHPDAAWWVEDDMARLYAPDLTLWIGSPQARITDENVDRLPGIQGPPHAQCERRSVRAIRLVDFCDRRYATVRVTSRKGT